MARAYPDDAVVRERLAKGLYNIQVNTKVEDDRPPRRALLDELRVLARTRPNDAAVRERC